MEKKLLNVKKACEHCKKCKDLHKQFYQAESNGLGLAIENFKLKKALAELMSG